MSDGYAIEYLPIAELVPYAKNARTHSDEQIAQIAASIREFGWTNPVLIDGHNGIVAGHGRVRAARTLGIHQVPCLRLDFMDEEQRRAYVLADNQLATQAGWDTDLLRGELLDLRELGFDLSLAGFDPLEVEDLLRGTGEGGEGGEGGKDNGLQLLIVSTNADLIAQVKRRLQVPPETNRVSAHDVLRMFDAA